MIILARFFCAVVLHIYMHPEIEQSFQLQKYALNHTWKFTDWGFAFAVGLMQMLVTLSVELVNVVILNTNHSIMDIIMNFLALVIIAEFDDYLVVTIEKHLPLRKLMNDKEDNEFEIEEGGRVVKVNDLLRWEVTTSDSARFNVKGNEFGKTRRQPLKGEPEFIFVDWS